MNRNHTPDGGLLLREPQKGPGQLLADSGRLLDSSSTPAEFYAEFLQRVLAGVEGIAAAVWASTPQGAFQLEHQVNVARIGLERIPDGRACHAEVLRALARRDRTLWVPPHSGPGTKDDRPAAANLTDYGLLLAPILVDKQVIGAVEVWLEPNRDAEARRAAARLLGELAGVAAAFLHRSQWRLLQEHQQFLAQLDGFARLVHGSLDPREVACLVANGSRPLLGCDQVGVALRRSRGVRVEAVSGATEVERGGRLVRALQALGESVLQWGERLEYRGSRDEALPPPVLAALDAYLAESGCRTLVAVPLGGGQGGEREACCVLVAESFTPDAAPQLLENRLNQVAAHAAPALYNALEHDRLARGWLPRPLNRLADWAAGRRLRRLVLAAAAVAVLGAALAFLPAPLRIDARGQLVPKECQTVFTHVTGRVVDIRTQHGDRVDRGQELLFVEDLDLQLKVEQLSNAIHFAEQRLAVLAEQLGKASAAEERNTLVKDRIDQEYELRKATVERDLLLQGSRHPRRAPVLAPLAGKVITFDAREQLAGKTVKPGDPLLRIARVAGPWEVEVLIPEKSIAAVREGLDRSAGDPLEVELLLASHPLRSFRGLLGRDGLAGETTVRDNAVALPARVRIADDDLAGQLGTLPVGLEVRVRIGCGTRSAGAVWFGDLAEFCYEHLLF